MPEARVNGVRLSYEIAGQGPNLVLIHGMSVDRRMWDDQVKHFSRSFRVITYDSRGHGKTEAPLTGYSAENRIEDLYQLLRHLNVAKCHLVGLSMGAGTAFGFAVRHPEMLESLVVADGAPASPPPPGAPRGGGIGGGPVAAMAQQGKLKEALEEWLKMPVFGFSAKKPEAWAKLRPIVMDHSGAIWRDPANGTYPPSDDLAKASQLRVPTLFIWGDNDMPNLIQTCEKAIGVMPNARKAVIKDAGHMANLDQPQAFNQALSQFFASVGAKVAV